MALKKNGCHNRKPFSQTLEVANGWTVSGQRIMKTIPFVMTRDCQYRNTELGKADAGCTGCTWRDQ